MKLGIVLKNQQIITHMLVAPFPSGVSLKVFSAGSVKKG